MVGNGPFYAIAFLFAVSLGGHFWQSWQLATLVRTVLGSQRFLPIGTERAVEQVAVERDIAIEKRSGQLTEDQWLKVMEDRILEGKSK